MPDVADAAVAQAALADALPFREFRDCLGCFGCPLMVNFPAGPFTMGVPPGEEEAESVLQQFRGFFGAAVAGDFRAGRDNRQISGDARGILKFPGRDEPPDGAVMLWDDKTG